MLEILKWMGEKKFKFKMKIILFRFLWLFLAIIFATFAMLSKEQGITVIGVCIVYEVAVVQKLKLGEKKWKNCFILN